MYDLIIIDSLLRGAHIVRSIERCASQTPPFFEGGDHVGQKRFSHRRKCKHYFEGGWGVKPCSEDPSSHPAAA